MAAPPHQWFDSFGDLATWFGSVGSVAAFTVAFLQIHRERKHRRMREITDRLRRRRAHADKVTAWITGSELVVANHSGHPVHELAVTVATARAVGGSAPPADVEPIRLPFVLPGEQRFDVPHPPDVTLLPALTFTDARGDRWHRGPGAAPTLVSSERPRGADDGAGEAGDGEVGTDP